MFKSHFHDAKSQILASEILFAFLDFKNQLYDIFSSSIHKLIYWDSLKIFYSEFILHNFKILSSLHEVKNKTKLMNGTARLTTKEIGSWNKVGFSLSSLWILFHVLNAALFYSILSVPAKFENILIFFYWNAIALQCRVGFWCTVKWITHIYPYIPSLLDLPPSPPSPPRRCHHRAPSWAPCAIWQPPTS